MAALAMSLHLPSCSGRASAAVRPSAGPARVASVGLPWLALGRRAGTARAAARPGGAVLRVRAAADSDAAPMIGRVQLPARVDKKKFQEQMYQWAATITVSGQNMPFALPLKVDPTPAGFTIALLHSSAAGGGGAGFGPWVTIDAAVEGDYFMIRKRTTSAAASIEFPDIPIIMGGMEKAVKRVLVEMLR